METALLERPRMDKVELESIRDANQSGNIPQEAAEGKGNLGGLDTMELEIVYDDGKKEWLEAIKENTIEGIRRYYESSSPSMKIAAVMLNEIMLTTGLNELGHEILNKLRTDIFDEKVMGGEDPEEINFMRGIICGINFTTYLI